MSLNTNPLNPDRRKRVLLVASNASVSKQTGWPIGAWLAEIAHPYHCLTEVGYEVVIASPQGGRIELDGYSDPRDASGYSADDLLSWGFISSPAHAALLESSPALATQQVADFDAVFLAGGQAPMYTFRGNEAISRLVLDFWKAGKPVAIVCHATCILLDLQGPDGELLVKGRTWTGFADAEEQFADGFVGQRIQPFWIETEAKKLAGTHFITGGMFRAFAVRDGQLITGQQQFSGAAAADLLIEALGR
jgi:putative intracellular protease/amidase